MVLRGPVCISTVDDNLPATLAGALVGYGAGFVVVFIWTRLLHRGHGLDEPHRGALPAALMGGALGGLSVLVLATVRHL